jgi:hypothetical protein
MNIENELGADLNNIITDFNRLKEVNKGSIRIMQFYL